MGEFGGVVEGCGEELVVGAGVRVAGLNDEGVSVRLDEEGGSPGDRVEVVVARGEEVRRCVWGVN